MAEASAALECFFAMLGKTDGRDKMLATLQYCAMFVGGMDKNAKATTIFKALGGARKPFRFVKVRGRRSISDASGREHEAPSPSHLLAPGARGSARTRIGRTHQLEHLWGYPVFFFRCVSQEVIGSLGPELAWSWLEIGASGDQPSSQR